jgi:hypothetical protein
MALLPYKLVDKGAERRRRRVLHVILALAFAAALAALLKWALPERPATVGRGVHLAASFVERQHPSLRAESALEDALEPAIQLEEEDNDADSGGAADEVTASTTTAGDQPPNSAEAEPKTPFDVLETADKQFSEAVNNRAAKSPLAQCRPQEVLMSAADAAAMKYTNEGLKEGQTVEWKTVTAPCMCVAAFTPLFAVALPSGAACAWCFGGLQQMHWHQSALCQSSLWPLRCITSLLICALLCVSL